MSCVFDNKNQVCNVGISFEVCFIARSYQGGRVDAIPMFRASQDYRSFLS